MSIRMQRDINELTERVEKLEALHAVLVAKVDMLIDPLRPEPKRGRHPKNQDEAHA